VVGDGDRALSWKNGVRSVARGAGVDYIENVLSCGVHIEAKGLYLGTCLHNIFKLFIIYVRKMVPEACWYFGVLRAGNGR